MYNRCCPSLICLTFCSIESTKTPLDGYIPQIFTWTSFGQPDDLSSLYGSASYFFSDANTDTRAQVERRGNTYVDTKELLENIAEGESGSVASSLNGPKFLAGLAALAASVHFMVL